VLYGSCGGAGSGTEERNRFDFPALAADYQRLLGTPAAKQVRVRLGVELGSLTRDIPYADVLRDALPQVDFIIGSQHQLSARYLGEDLYFCAARDEAAARGQIEDYLAQTLLLAKWGRFSVLGHLTLPLRYMNENNGLHMSFDGYEAEVEEIYRS
jgi:histidinol-phosphatase (PHP family)